jgi:hypothetical protein
MGNMKTKILVTVLMLTTVAAFSQSERREGSSNTNGKSRTQSVEEKKKTTDQTVKTDNNARSSSSDNQRTVKETPNRNAGTGSNSREVNRSSDRSNTVTGNPNERNNGTNSRVNTGNSENRRSENAGEVKTETRRDANNNGRTVSSGRTETNNGNHNGTQQRENGGEGRRVQDQGGNDQGGNRNVNAGRSENPSRDRDNRTVTTTTNRNAQVDSRVSERRYASSNHTRVETHHNVYVNPPRPIEYRRVHEPYRRPVYVDIYWTPGIRDEYYGWYPEYRHWNRDLGTRIETISAYDAYDYIGDVARVYGKIYDVDYNYQNDEYYFYFGSYYPYQDFSAVVPGWVAREFSHKPRRFFLGRHISVTGLITIYDDRPEILVRRPGQIDRYY